MSKLFELASQATKNLAARQFARTPIGQLTREIYRVKTMAKPDWRVKQLARKLNALKSRTYLEEIERLGGIERYGISASVRKAVSDVLGIMGPVGQILKGIFEGNTKTFTDTQLDAAKELIRAYGNEIMERPGEAGYDRGIEAARKVLEDRGELRKPNDKSLIQTMEEEAEPDPVIQRAAILRRDSEKTGMSELVLTPKSSNVYSLQYDFASSTLFVTFRAPVLNGKAVTNYRSAGGLMAMAGDRGKTVTGKKSNSPGPQYAYYDVPVRVWKRMKASVTTSVGGAVWDNLRIRGTIYGHQYRYGLSQGALVPGENGELAVYVPRRATRNGFRSRSVAMVGTGRRKFASSTLPEDVNRGKPNRGRLEREWRPYQGRGK